MRKRHDGRTSTTVGFDPAPDVSRETLDRLRAYAALLLRWNNTINLVGRADADAIWHRHIADSLRLLPFLPPGPGNGAGEGAKDAADLGSGAGLPGLVLAIAADRPFHLVEADARKAAFLAEAARLTAAPATVHACRIEAATLPPLTLVTARALAPLAKLLGLAAPLLRPGGECLFPKGATAEAEIRDARATWRFECDQLGTGGTAGPILRIRAIQPAATP